MGADEPGQRRPQCVAIRKSRFIGCKAPYAFEGAVRRDSEQVGAEIVGVRHAADGELMQRIAETSGPGFMARMHEVALGRIRREDVR